MIEDEDAPVLQEYPDALVVTGRSVIGMQVEMSFPRITVGMLVTEIFIVSAAVPQPLLDEAQ